MVPKAAKANEQANIDVCAAVVLFLPTQRSNRRGAIDIRALFPSCSSLVILAGECAVNVITTP